MNSPQPTPAIVTRAFQTRPHPYSSPPTQDKTAKSKASREEPLQRCRLTSALLRMCNHYGAEAYGAVIGQHITLEWTVSADTSLGSK